MGQSLSKSPITVLPPLTPMGRWASRRWPFCPQTWGSSRNRLFVDSSARKPMGWWLSKSPMTILPPKLARVVSWPIVDSSAHKPMGRSLSDSPMTVQPPNLRVVSWPPDCQLTILPPQPMGRWLSELPMTVLLPRKSGSVRSGNSITFLATGTG